MEELRDQRSHRAAGHDDGTFRAERTARADGNRRRQRLEQRDLRLDAAPVDEDRLDRFRNAVPADALGSVPRHGPDHERARDRHEDHQRAERMRLRRDQRGADPLKEEKIRKEADEREEAERDVRAHDSDADGECRDQQDTRGDREIAELFGDVASMPRARCLYGSHPITISEGTDRGQG